MKQLDPDEKGMLRQIDALAVQANALMDGIEQAPRTSPSEMSEARLAFRDFLDSLESAVGSKQ